MPGETAQAGVDCWSCRVAVAPGQAFCPSCRKIQPAGPGDDHFTALGLPRRYALDPAELERRFRDRSRRLHPDRFARAEARERRFSLERSTRLNEAYRVLRDPRRRAEYLLALQGRDPLAEARSLQDPEFLEEQLAVREALAEARAAGDEAARRRLAGAARARLARLADELAELFREVEGGRDRSAEIALRLARARYDDNVVQDAGPLD